MPMPSGLVVWKGSNSVSMARVLGSRSHGVWRTVSWTRAGTDQHHRPMDSQTSAVFESLAGLSRLVPYAEIIELFTTDYRTRQADGLRE